MGVPAFYRWLSEKYPKIVEDVLEERVELLADGGSIRKPFDATAPNPSNLECDNLYIDMNGIIHPCSHPEHGPQPTCEHDMYENVCRYVDRLFRAVRPRKLLYLAIDGVAPRAKMNQQRSRRFRSAQEIREQMTIEEDLKRGLEQQGHVFEKSSKPWDSNVITPGTVFMKNLSTYIRFYVRKRISNDEAWKNIQVIFSDASIPGEGEHKIISHVRHQRAQPTYNPNLVHVLHGLDADLIMLGLATHEAHFYILREEVTFGRKSVQDGERRKEESGHSMAQKQFDDRVGAAAMELPENKTKPLQRISIPILREYLVNEFQSCSRVPFRGGFNFERVIDDIVFLCFFVGNDFLPHLPSLDIRDGALDFLFNVYKRILPSMGDYITSDGGEVNLSHVDVILAEVGQLEDYVFSMKHENEQNDKKRQKEFVERKKLLTKDGQAPSMKINPSSGKEVGLIPAVRGRARRILDQKSDSTSTTCMNGPQHNAKTGWKGKLAAKKQNMKKGSKENGDTDQNPPNADGDCEKEAHEENEQSTSGTKRQAQKNLSVDDDNENINQGERMNVEESNVLLKQKLGEAKKKQLDNYVNTVEDKVRLHEKGWKDRYYADKCKATDVAEHGGKEHLFRSYIVGLCWVMKYYYDGCPSWTFYYPFHYSPFASDLRNIERFKNDCKFDLGEPFKPVEQLMAVLPEDSSHAIPIESRWLMSDPESPIIDFYPKEVLCDPNGKAMPWLWVVLLPFIDEERLFAAMAPTVSKWSTQESECNERGTDDGYVYCHVGHHLASVATLALDSHDTDTKFSIEDNAQISSLSGVVRKPPSDEVYPLDKVSSISPPSQAKETLNEAWDALFTTNIERNAALCVSFAEPVKKLHKSSLLQGVRLKPPILTNEDKKIRRPRLNRGGATIANMGMGNHRDAPSSQSGYGSMHISAYERDLAQRAGRGNQMNQAGTRTWGSMEPVAKRQRRGNPIQIGNAIAGPNGHMAHSFQAVGRSNNGNSHLHSMNNRHNQSSWAPPHHQPRSIPPPQHRHQRTHHFPPPPPPPPRHDFRNFNRQNQNHGYSQYNQHQRQQQPSSQRTSGVSSDKMKSLRSQLASTLNRNKSKGSGRK